MLGPAPAGILQGMSAFGDFVRARREQLRPADVGLPTSGRRRTPGLRREELAALAGVSIDYLIRLEQGRDRNPSTEIIGALATALQLDVEERRHLGKMATQESRDQLCGESLTDHPAVPTGVQRLLDRMDAIPAFVTGPADDIQAANARLVAIGGPLGMLDGDPPNLARWTFLDPRARAVHEDWEGCADARVQQLRSESAMWFGDDRLEALLDELRAVPAFERRWAAHRVAEKRRGRKVLRHPTLGRLAVDYESLELRPGQRLITWLPGDAATEQAFDAVEVDAPARLRLVEGA